MANRTIDDDPELPLGHVLTRRRFLRGAGLVAMPSLLVSCGGEDDEDPTPTPEPPATPPTSAASPPPSSPMASPVASPAASPSASPAP